LKTGPVWGGKGGDLDGRSGPKRGALIQNFPFMWGGKPGEKGEKRGRLGGNIPRRACSHGWEEDGGLQARGQPKLKTSPHPQKQNSPNISRGRGGVGGGGGGGGGGAGGVKPLSDRPINTRGRGLPGEKVEGGNPNLGKKKGWAGNRGGPKPPQGWWGEKPLPGGDPKNPRQKTGLGER